MHFTSRSRVVALLIIPLAIFGCRQEAKQQQAAQQVSSAMAASQPPDTTGAAVWSYLQETDYRANWAPWPEKGELYTGQEPHGMLLTTYLNDGALEAVTTHGGSMPVGAIVVKENYTPDSTLAAVTVMYKVDGYNPDHSDWFFAKYLPDGTLDKAPNGMALEGRVAGCQNCHGEQAENDYIFTSSLSN